MVKVLLIGMGPTALSAFESLASKFNVLGIIRNKVSEDDDPIIIAAQNMSVPIFSDTSQASIETLVLRLKPDCVVVSSYNRILKAKLIEQCPFVNVHYSPLPQYRGHANVNWALINDEPCAAITIHTIIPELDAGNILFQRLIPIENNNSVADVYNRLNKIQREYLADTLMKFMRGEQGIPQHNEDSTYCCSRISADGEINWTSSTRQIYCLIRALAFPFPGAYTYFQGEKLLVWKAKPLENPPNYVGRIPGRIVNISKSDGYVDVLTEDSIIRIFEVQFEAEEKTSAANIIKSVRATLGLQVVDLLERIKSLEQQVVFLTEEIKNQKYAE